MSLIDRHIGIAIAATLALAAACLLAFADYHNRPAPAGEPPFNPPAAAPPLAVEQKKPRPKKRPARPIPPPPPEIKIRGARLKEKGEALGGRAPGRVDVGTMTVPSAQ